MNPLQKKALRAFGVCLALHVSAILLMWMFESSDHSPSYTEPVHWRQVFAGVTNLNVQSLTRGVELHDWLVLLAIASGMVLALRNRLTGNWSLGFLAVQPVAFAFGWGGVLLWVALPFEAVGMDGEWFGEGTPLALSSGAWVVACTITAVAAFRQRRRTQPVA